MALVNTLFPLTISGRATWHSPDCTTDNQIDDIVAPRRFKSSINRAQSRTVPGADINADHDLVIKIMKLTFLRNHGPRLKFNLERL